jgi:hypothetical protein
MKRRCKRLIDRFIGSVFDIGMLTTKLGLLLFEFAPFFLARVLWPI